MFVYSSPDWTDETLFEIVRRLKATTGSLSCLEWDDEARGVQLQHPISPLDVTQFYRLNL